MKKIFLFIMMLLMLSGCFNSERKEENNVDNKAIITDNELTNMINNYNFMNDEVNIDFLKWIYNRYGNDIIKKIQSELEKGTYNTNTWHKLTGNSLIVLLDYYKGIYEISNNIKVINTQNNEVNLGFVGDVSLADNFDIMPKYDERGQGIYGILSEDVVDIMKSMDIMVANNEFTISNRGEPLPNKLYTFRANTSRVSIYSEMGVDLLTLANNHVYDFGEEAFLDTLDTLEKNNLPYIGAGRNISEASRPFYFIANGYKIAFVNATRAEKYILTPEATETSSGVLRAYDPTKFKEVISETKKIVILLLL